MINNPMLANFIETDGYRLSGKNWTKKINLLNTEMLLTKLQVKNGKSESSINLEIFCDIGKKIHIICDELHRM